MSISYFSRFIRSHCLTTGVNGAEGMEEQKEILKRMNGQAISDCWMIAAESFCGIEQMTARVEPVAIISDPGYGLKLTIWEIRQREIEINPQWCIHTRCTGCWHNVDMCNGCSMLQHGYWSPVYYAPWWWSCNGETWDWSSHMCQLELKSEPIITTQEA